MPWRWKNETQHFRVVRVGTQSKHHAVTDQKDVRGLFQGSKELEGTTVHLCTLGETNRVSDGPAVPPFENHSLCEASWQVIVFLVPTGCHHAGPMCTAILPKSWCCLGISKIAISQQGSVINLLCMFPSLQPKNKRSPLSFFLLFP